jgi:hypothetical protein
LFLLLVVLTSAGCQFSFSIGSSTSAKTVVAENLMTRTELFLGMSRPNGPDVSEAEFQAFLEEEVTPRFPEGYTVMEAEGRWRDTETGKTIKERSRILLMIYPRNDDSTQGVKAIRNAYETKFAQQAVLWMNVNGQSRDYR